MFGSKLRLKKIHATLSEIFTPLFWSDIQATSSNIHAILPRIFMPPPGCVSVLCCDVPADCLPPACPPSLVDSLRQPLLPTATDHCLRPPTANRIGSVFVLGSVFGDYVCLCVVAFGMKIFRLHKTRKNKNTRKFTPPIFTPTLLPPKHANCPGWGPVRVGAHMGPQGPYGPIRAHMGPYGPI